MKRFFLKGTNQDSKERSEVKTKRFDKEAFIKPIRVLFYLIMILIIIKGALSFFRNDTNEAKKIYAEMEMKLIAARAPIETETAKAFAESFTKEFLTYSNDSTSNYDYTERVRPYIASYLSGITAQSFGQVKKTWVEDVFTWEVQKISEAQGNIVVKADIIYEDKVVEGETEKLVLKKDKVYLKVPIFYQEGKFVVDDYPVFHPVPEKAEIKFEPIYLEDTSSEIKEEVSFMLQNFFKTYCMGNAGEISYYMLDGSKLKGYEGRFEFLEIKELRTHTLKDQEGKILAVAAIKVKDKTSSMEFTQRYHLEVFKKDSRWYIESFDTRGGNLEKYKKKGDEV